jgi:uncharacterized repeat protein (TIGR03803 family)
VTRDRIAAVSAAKLICRLGVWALRTILRPVLGRASTGQIYMATRAIACVFGCAAALHSPVAAGAAYNVVYSFGANGSDAYWPQAGLIDVKGTLYGTSVYGGANDYGAVFSFVPNSGKETVLYSFYGIGDGQWPVASLINLHGSLYGTTSFGGALYCHIICNMGSGTVFSYNRSTGVESTLYAFCGDKACPDGAVPYAPLTQWNGLLYGTTTGGGANGGGIVFSIDPSTRKLTVVYNFCGRPKCADGADPFAGLVNVNGTLYGTTTEGGANNRGTVFAINAKTGVESVVYSFCSQKNCKDGAEPWAGLIEARGALYGTTYGGGNTESAECVGNAFDGCGTVFSLDPATRKETVLYDFCNGKHCADGMAPTSALTYVNATLYGTTLFGGRPGCGGFGCHGLGILFSLDPATRTETVLHTFGKGVDGASPYGGLTNVRGRLYGTTFAGGSQSEGTVFKMKP